MRISPHDTSPPAVSCRCLTASLFATVSPYGCLPLWASGDGVEFTLLLFALRMQATASAAGRRRRAHDGTEDSPYPIDGHGSLRAHGYHRAPAHDRAAYVTRPVLHCASACSIHLELPFRGIPRTAQTLLIFVACCLCLPVVAVTEHYWRQPCTPAIRLLGWWA